MYVNRSQPEYRIFDPAEAWDLPIQYFLTSVSLFGLPEKSSQKAKNWKEIDYSDKSGKPEPKFEPRISMYKYDPVQGVSHLTICLFE